MGVGTRSYSKVIQDSLNWAIAYHGTKRPNPAFTIPGFNQSSFDTKGLLFGPGHYFTDNAEEIAGGYAGSVEKAHVHKVFRDRERAEKVARRLAGKTRVDETLLEEVPSYQVEGERLHHFHYSKVGKNQTPNIHKVAIDLKNPFEIDGRTNYNTGDTRIQKVMSELGMPSDYFSNPESIYNKHGATDPSDPFGDIFNNASDSGKEKSLSGRELYRDFTEYKMREGVGDVKDVKAHAKSRVNAALEKGGFDGITHQGGGIWQDEINHNVSIAFNQSQVKPYWEAMAEVSAARDVRTRARNKIFLNKRSAARIENEATGIHRSLAKKISAISSGVNKTTGSSVSNAKSLGFLSKFFGTRGSSTVKSSIAMLTASAAFGLGAPTLMNMTDVGHSILTTGGIGHTRLMEEDRARALVKKSFPLLYKDAKVHGKAMPTSIPPIYEMDKPNKEYFAKRETNPMIRGDYIHVDPSDKNIVSSTGHEMRHAFQAATFDNESAFNKAYSGDTTKFGLQKNRFELDASNVEKRLASGEFISPSMEREALQYLDQMPYRRPSLLPKTAISVSAGSVSNTIKQSGTTNRGTLYKLLGKIK